ncbi:MAG: NAD(P)H-quinone oxidoreductase subunit O [Synechococcales cyanobacterium K44_A2020_017]|uniref:NAD(P)H-quinone oxidoreductase subunit O n=1 Tax=Leptolyngbya sp. CCY15150 TaxID=2767772 RepID=UPI001951E0F2|nr:NAD(P)H-quinone oxidoreductase subunit O [Leptolyngbya sp. CCY15150]MBF2088063.1 NAD(P)H-quinone oxidoreductase subunit O [Synechococcales cyanobacterium K32_A2020_035]MBF2096009.1 NAD(P)H-quinone oxidoreductase subunit O [Synechococcales cyanobacterium K44_A2020_017]
MALKKGDVVRALRDKLDSSVEASASDTRWPPYIFETKGEIMDTRDDYALVQFGYVPTPNMWLRLDQLEKFE